MRLFNANQILINFAIDRAIVKSLRIYTKLFIK